MSTKHDQLVQFFTPIVMQHPNTSVAELIDHVTERFAESETQEQFVTRLYVAGYSKAEAAAIWKILQENDDERTS